jgi:hypothetical protein
MYFRYRSWILLGGALGVLSLLFWAQAAYAQNPPATVQLVSDTCPVVHAGDKIAFDWNPVFDPEWPVIDVSSASLHFARQEENGASLLMRSMYILGGRTSPVNVTVIANGYYHLEFTVKIDRGTQFGVYQLVQATMNARVEKGYDGPAPQMTRSPVENRFCFTLQKAH